MTEIKDAVNDNDTRITNNEAAISNNDTRITNNEAAINTNDTRLDQLGTFTKIGVLHALPTSCQGVHKMVSHLQIQ